MIFTPPANRRNRLLRLVLAAIVLAFTASACAGSSAVEVADGGQESENAGSEQSPPPAAVFVATPEPAALEQTSTRDGALALPTATPAPIPTAAPSDIADPAPTPTAAPTTAPTPAPTTAPPVAPPVDDPEDDPEDDAVEDPTNTPDGEAVPDEPLTPNTDPPSSDGDSPTNRTVVELSDGLSLTGTFGPGDEADYYEVQLPVGQTLEIIGYFVTCPADGEVLTQVTQGGQFVGEGLCTTGGAAGPGWVRFENGGVPFLVNFIATNPEEGKQITLDFSVTAAIPADGDSPTNPSAVGVLAESPTSMNARVSAAGDRVDYFQAELPTTATEIAVSLRCRVRGSGGTETTFSQDSTTVGIVPCGRNESTTQTFSVDPALPLDIEVGVDREKHVLGDVTIDVAAIIAEEPFPIAPGDGDGPQNPVPVKAQTNVNGAVSGPTGDTADWFSFELFGDNILENTRFQCLTDLAPGSGAVATIFQDGAAVAKLVCDGGEPVQLVPLAFKPGSEYVISVELVGSGYVEWSFSTPEGTF